MKSDNDLTSASLEDCKEMEIIPLQSFCYAHAPIVSCPAWGNGMQTDRKLFAKGFLFGMGKGVCIPIENYWQKVSYSAWGKGYAYR